MKILFLVSSMHRGGAERVAATLCNAWAQRGDEVTLIATYSGRGECHYALDNNISFVYLADLVASDHGKILGYVPRLRALRRLVRQQMPDVIISFLTNVNISAALATSGQGIPLIVSERTNPFAATNQSNLALFPCRLLYPLADLVIAQTESVAKRLRTYIPRAQQIDVVANPIPEALLDIRKRERTHDTRRRLIAMGRLSSEKQFHHLIDVFSDFAARYSDVDLWIWGEGPLRPELEAQIDNVRLKERIFLPGRTDSPWTEMARAEMLILTSAYEGFPNVMLEAMALGLPCVAYDCNSGPRDLSEDGQVAQLVPQNDKERLRDEITTLLEDAVLRSQLGAAAADSVQRRYRIETILAQWDRLILTARRNRGLICT